MIPMLSLMTLKTASTSSHREARRHHLLPSPRPVQYRRAEITIGASLVSLLLGLCLCPTAYADTGLVGDTGTEPADDSGDPGDTDAGGESYACSEYGLAVGESTCVLSGSDNAVAECQSDGSLSILEVCSTDEYCTLIYEDTWFAECEVSTEESVGCLVGEEQCGFSGDIEVVEVCDATGTWTVGIACSAEEWCAFDGWGLT